MNRWARAAHRSILLARSKALDRPILVEWSFNARCNLTCPFCRGYASTELDATNALQLAAQIAALAPWRVILEGGEPFLRGDLPEVIRVLAEAGIPTTIFTNGTAVRFDWLARLGSASVDVAVSVDAEEPALYRTLRPGADQQSVWRNIRQLGDAGTLSGVVITASKLTSSTALAPAAFRRPQSSQSSRVPSTASSV